MLTQNGLNEVIPGAMIPGYVYTFSEMRRKIFIYKPQTKIECGVLSVVDETAQVDHYPPRLSHVRRTSRKSKIAGADPDLGLPGKEFENQA